MDFKFLDEWSGGLSPYSSELWRKIEKEGGVIVDEWDEGNGPQKFIMTSEYGYRRWEGGRNSIVVYAVPEEIEDLPCSVVKDIFVSITTKI